MYSAMSGVENIYPVLLMNEEINSKHEFLSTVVLRNFHIHTHKKTLSYTKSVPDMCIAL